MKEEMVIAGKIHGTHGVRGDLKVEVFPPNFKLPETVYVKTKDGGFEPLQVEAYSKKKGLIRFKGYDDLDKAKKIKHRYFYVEASKLPQLSRDTFYEYEILDADVIFNGKKIGKVVKVDDRLSTAYLIIKCADEKTRHLPFINQFVKQVDRKNRQIHIQPPEGWFSL
ncbi:MAG: 16S rRNA processing protein RimM [Aquificae bacterium]|nr:16S rRNA processing protein RimM [Aquificota bacterium]